MTAREILGVDLNATGEEIRAAYLEKVKDYPPDIAPDEFERIRDAYDTLRDPRRRMNDILNNRHPIPAFSELFAGLRPERRFVGSKPWLEVIKGK